MIDPGEAMSDLPAQADDPAETTPDANPATSSFSAAHDAAGDFLKHVERLNARYRAGEIHVNVPEELRDMDRSLDDAVEAYLPASHAAMAAASAGLFSALPVAFDPSESVGPYVATIDRDPAGRPRRWIDMGALIATQAFGENDPAIACAMLAGMPYVVSRYAHSEYQTQLSLTLKAQLARFAPAGTPRFFMVNTGAEAVENAIKAVLLSRVRETKQKDGFVVISYLDAFHGRTLGALAVTNRKKASLGFPTFDWPQVPFPSDDPRSPAATLRREEMSLRQIYELTLAGKLTSTPKSRESFRLLLERIDRYLGSPGGDLESFLARERGRLTPEESKRTRRVAAVLVEPIQGEGGVQVASARYFRRLRLLTKIFDVPLVFDEVQTGFGATGKLWAHEHFDLPAPPDAVTWAKKAQNGVLFVSEKLATFFQEEKKFNTTWEGDSVGMLRLLAILDKLDLDQVRRTGALAREGLEKLARKYPEFIQNVRGAGVMWGIDVARADWRDVLRDGALRGGLILLPCGERSLRVYPRFDTEPYAMDEAFSIFERSIDAVLAGSAPLPPQPAAGSEPPAAPLARVKARELDKKIFGELKAQIMSVEKAAYGAIAQYPADVRKAGQRPLLQYPLSELRKSIGYARSAGVALLDEESGKVTAYALGSPLENYDEDGVRDDPHFGERNTFYLQAMAVLPSLPNRRELAGQLLSRMRSRAAEMGYEQLSLLVEAEVLEMAPEELAGAVVLNTFENHLRSGRRFVYLQVPLAPPAVPTL
jgi:4-aminobutyrate aminotransferase-like enzyme